MAELNLTKQTFSSDFFIIRNGVTYCVDLDLQVDFNRDSAKISIKAFDFAVCLTEDFPERFSNFLAEIVRAAIQKKEAIGGDGRQLSMFGDDQLIDNVEQFEQNEALH